MRGIGYLDALASIFGERPKHLRKGLRLDRMLEKLRFLDGQTDDTLSGGRARLRQELQSRDQERALKTVPCRSTAVSVVPSSTATSKVVRGALSSTSAGETVIARPGA